jgi:hypothetical protein
MEEERRGRKKKRGPSALETERGGRFLGTIPWLLRRPAFILIVIGV